MLPPSTATAQEAAVAMPVPAVVAETVAAPAIFPGDGPTVIELFSSQACIFCPRADRLLADLVQQPNVIGIACHIDYFDVKQGALSQPFCTARQTWYESLLRVGPIYTPQMVLQGQIDTVGYKMGDVSAAIKKAEQLSTMPLYVFATDNEDEYRIALPDTISPVINGNAVLHLIMYDRPHEITVAEGRNKGQKITYMNIASATRNLGVWPETQQGTIITAPLTETQEGFAVLLQDNVSGKILAAGKFKKSSAPPPN